MIRTKKILLVLVAGTFLAGCFHQQAKTESSASPKAPAQSTKQKEGQANLEIKDFAYSPIVLKVKPGEIVTVTNRDVAGHSVTSDDGSSFDTGVMGKEQSKTFTAPTTPGTYGIHCTPHPSIKGTVIVE